jgi:hypothetical protein
MKYTLIDLSDYNLIIGSKVVLLSSGLGIMSRIMIDVLNNKEIIINAFKYL